jgi:hypothetical protein
VPPAPRERRPREARDQAGGRELVATREEVVESTQQGTDQTDEMVKKVFKCLVDCWKAGGRQPVNYFRLLLDPESFGRSVENIFHMSFLVKQKMVEVQVGESGLPEVIPIVKKKQKELQEREGNVASLGITSCPIGRA